jgi:SAM-dependent methyltransferase
MEFGKSNLREGDIHGKSVIEVGSRDVNGSLRAVVEAFGPQRYVGVDIQPGPGVDEICDAGDLVEHFGRDAFDVLICTELLEHVRDWRRVISNLKQVLTPAGMLLITTRSRGFGYHGHPFDFWRYEVADMERIFSDLEGLVVEKDRSMPGVFVIGRKPAGFQENELSEYRLFSIVTGRRVTELSPPSIFLSRLKYTILRGVRAVVPKSVRQAVRSALSSRRSGDN